MLWKNRSPRLSTSDKVQESRSDELRPSAPSSDCETDRQKPVLRSQATSSSEVSTATVHKASKHNFELIRELTNAQEILREEMEALKQCLTEAGVLSEATFTMQLHRARSVKISKTRGEYPRHFLDQVFASSRSALCIAKGAGLQSILSLRSCSKRIRLATTKVTEPGTTGRPPVCLYACGGGAEHGNFRSVECLDVTSGCWEVSQMMSKCRAAPAAGIVGSLLYVAGGVEAGNTFLRSAERFDAQTKTWEALAPMADWRARPAGAVLGGRFYVLGGYDGVSCLRSVERFVDSEDPNLKGGVWEQVAEMSEARAGLGACAIGGLLYACGGTNGIETLKSAERLDVDAGEWEPLPQMTVKRQGLAVVAHHYMCYAIGGSDGANNLKSIERLDPAHFDMHMERWERLPSMSVRRSGFSANVVAGEIYVCGGSDNSSNILNSVERFDPKTGAWAPAPAMLEARDVLAGAVMGRHCEVAPPLEDIRTNVPIRAERVRMAFRTSMQAISGYIMPSTDPGPVTHHSEQDHRHASPAPERAHLHHSSSHMGTLFSPGNKHHFESNDHDSRDHDSIHHGKAPLNLHRSRSRLSPSP